VLFSSTVFLFLFLPLTLTLYFLAPRKLKNTVLLLASLFFYAWGEPKFVIFLLLSIVLNYIFALLVEKNREKHVLVKWVVAVTVIANLSILIVFKYANFIVENLNNLLGTTIELGNIPFPLGISFFTFQGLSYVIDVYRKDAKAQRNLINMAMYKALFPQLIAGPIVRYVTVAHQIDDRKESIPKFAEGTKRFIIGLAKKMILANNCGWVADQVFAMPPGEISVGMAWIGIIAYSLQIYFDFSGYSDMAIGLGKMFGFDFLENFNYPYIARSATDFWRRWHISLSTWFKDYLYIPLGGNRGGTFMTYRNLFIVWMATGIWHGAAWTFIAWGVYYGVLIMLEKAFLLKLLKSIPRVFQHLYALLAVMIGWVFFRAETFTYGFDYLKVMFGASGNPIWDQQASFYFAQYGIIILIAIIAATPVFHWFKERFLKQGTVGATSGRDLVVTAGYAVIFFLTLVSVVSSTFNPFIYFRF
jgi:alginate O-acetyltransferase complex protein AlgI